MPTGELRPPATKLGLAVPHTPCSVLPYYADPLSPCELEGTPTQTLCTTPRNEEACQKQKLARFPIELGVWEQALATI